jgi:two-component system NtrC family sensor kinase
MMHQKQLENKNNALIRAQKELKEAQDSLIQNERLTAVKQLAVSVNHEINNPLSVITGNIEYLLYVNKDLDEKTVDRLKIISNEALRIAEINRRLLEIQALISETYVKDGNQIHMINLDKSTAGEQNA